MFFVGVLPAFFTLWVRRNVEEPELWRRARRRGQPAAFGDLFRGDLARASVALTLMNACTLFGWWGLNTWVPAYLVLPAAQGGAGLSIIGSSAVVFITQVGMWFGYVTFGFVADAIGRKRAYAIYIVAASLLLPLYGYVRNPLVLLALGPFIAFFGTGHYSGFGPLTAEIYPTAIRATAQGFTYNAGRLASAAAPFVIGSLAASRGFGAAFTVAGAAFLLAAIALYWVPDARNVDLDSVEGVGEPGRRAGRRAWLGRHYLISNVLSGSCCAMRHVAAAAVRRQRHGRRGDRRVVLRLRGCLEIFRSFLGRSAQT